MKKGTIIYVGGFELPNKNAAAHRVLNNGKILRRLGYKVVFIGVDRSNEKRKISDTKRIYYGFECWSIPYPSNKKEWVDYLSSIKHIEKINMYYDNIIGIVMYNYQAMAMYNLKKYCAKNNIRLIADCTEWYSAKEGNIIFKGIKGLDSFFRMRILHKYLDGLIVISEYLKKYYEKKIQLINIPPLIDLTEDKWNLDEKTSRNKSIIKFVYAGSMSKNKDHDKRILIKSFSELKNYNNYVFNIVGISKKQYLDNYPEDKDFLDALEDKIVFWGRVSHKESIKIVKDSDFSIFFRQSSRVVNAGFPTKFVESISCKVPVITTRTSDLESYLIEGENGYFIDDISQKGVTKFLKRILSMDRGAIDSIKKNTENDMFHYEKYIDTFDKFMRN